jgi:hypothetical protein
MKIFALMSVVVTMSIICWFTVQKSMAAEYPVKTTCTYIDNVVTFIDTGIGTPIERTLQVLANGTQIQGLKNMAVDQKIYYNPAISNFYFVKSFGTSTISLIDVDRFVKASDFVDKYDQFSKMCSQVPLTLDVRKLDTYVNLVPHNYTLQVENADRVQYFSDRGYHKILSKYLVGYLSRNQVSDPLAVIDDMLTNHEKVKALNKELKEYLNEFKASKSLNRGAGSRPSQISSFDIATYVLTNKDGQPTKMQIRLSQNQGAWVMEGREVPAPWKIISCDTGCEYRASIHEEEDKYLSYFPKSIQNTFSIACIQNMAQAFCRVSKKDNLSQGGYALIALVTGTPIPISLQRLPQQ